MARIRSVHPGLWTDEEFVQMSLAARLFLIGLWNEADDSGLFEWKPVRLKMRIAPADPIEPDSILSEIELHGFVVALERGGRRYGAIRNFRKYQRPKNPSSPIITLDDEVCGIVGLPLVGNPTPALPQPYPSPTEIPPQMEDGGGVEEKKEPLRGAEAPSADVLTIEGQVYKYGRDVLGPKGGGLVTKLKKHFSGNLDRVTEILHLAKGSGDPAAYVGGVLRKPPDAGFDPLKPKYTEAEIFPPALYRGLR